MSETKIIFRGGYTADNLGSSNPKRKPTINRIKVANAILARDYKGSKNFGMNVVIEVRRKDE